MKNSKAVIVKRQKEILNLLENRYFIKLSDLAEEMKVSLATIRRDILTLEKSGEVAVRMGGVELSTRFKTLPNFDSAPMRMETASIKDAIAKCAATLLNDGDSVFMNASSTVMRVLPYIQNKSITVITNNGRSPVMERSPSVELVVIGGEVVNDNPNGPVTKAAMTGEFATSMINRINATKCILGVSGISASGGLTSMAVQDPAVNKAMIHQCTGPVIVVADHRKIGVRHNFYFGSISDVSHLITDSKSSPLELERIRSMGVEVLVVDAED